MLYLQSDHPLQADIVSKTGVRKFLKGKSIVLSTKLVDSPACWRHLYDNRRVVAVYCTSVNCNPLTPLLRFVVDLWYKLLRHFAYKILTDNAQSVCCSGASYSNNPDIIFWHYTITGRYSDHAALKEDIAPGAARRYAPADGSSTRGGSTSVRGRVRSPHMAARLGLGQTDGQTNGRIAVSLNDPLRRGT